jgi:hypothetical protein
VAGSGCATGLTGSPNHVENDFANIEGGVVSTAGGEVDYWVQYGTTTAYGSQTTPDTVSVAQNAPTSVTVVVSGLQRATLYHYRFCAEDDDQPDGPGCGEDRTFTTQSFACGETVTSDVRTDMLCFSKPGLVVGADGVDVNLSGHSLDGGTTGFPNGPTGIDNSGGFDDVTVRNGRLPNWGDAISATDASRNRILSVDATGKTTAIRLTRGDHNEVRRSQLAGGLWALRATDSANLVVANSVVDATPGTGILITNGSTARVARNRVERLSVPSSPTAGIQVDGSAGGRIVENVVTGPWTFGGIWARLTSGIVRDNEVSGERSRAARRDHRTATGCISSTPRGRLPCAATSRTTTPETASR